MARTSIKGTYSLDVETVQALERIAQGWGVSKSEALRRIIQAAEKHEHRRRQADRLDALDRAQDSLALTRADARRWEQRVHAERKSSTRRPGSRPN